MKKNDIISYLCIIVLVLLIRTFIFLPVTVYGDSMYPNLQNEERTIGLKIGEIHRFDIISFHAPDKEDASYIKRVIGLPGETVKYQDDTLYINGEKMEEPYLDDMKANLAEGELLTDDFKYVVPKDSYFVMGDNRQISKDSRIIGAIERSRITANVKFAIYPLNELGTLN